MAAPRIAKSKSLAAREPEEKLYLKLRRAGPRIIDVEAEELEAATSDPQQHMWRRAAIVVQEMSGEELCGKIDADRKGAVVFAEMAVGILDYVTALRALADFLDTAQARVELALCAGEDCREVRAEAAKRAA